METKPTYESVRLAAMARLDMMERDDFDGCVEEWELYDEDE